MRTAGLACAAALAAASLGCGATTTRGASTFGTDPSVTRATATFMTRDDGKDEDSAIAVQILDASSRLSAEGTVVDVEFDDQTVSSPLALAVTRPLRAGDLDDARVRLRLTPDDRDDWRFDLRMTVEFSDGTERSYFWEGLRLDESAPERVLTFSSGRLP